MDLNVCSEETDDISKQSVVEALEVVQAPETVVPPETVIAAKEVHQVPTVAASKPKYRYVYNCLSVPFFWHVGRRVTLFCLHFKSPFKVAEEIVHVSMMH